MKCKEVAVFKFKEDCINGAIELNKKLISEMQNASNDSLLDFEVYQSAEDPTIFTWLIDWTDIESAKEVTDKWLSFLRNQKFLSCLENDIFYKFLEKR